MNKYAPISLLGKCRFSLAATILYHTGPTRGLSDTLQSEYLDPAI